MEENLAVWKTKVHDIIFGHETPAGKAFDLILLFAIISSVAVLMLDSIEELNKDYGALLNGLEWMFTGFFTIEYILRVMTAKRPKVYVKSFFGMGTEAPPTGAPGTAQMGDPTTGEMAPATGSAQ